MVRKLPPSPHMSIEHPFKTSVSADEQDSEPAGSEMSRREYISTLGLVAGAVTFGVPVAEAEPPVQAADSIALVPLSIRVNGTSHRLSLDARVTLLDLLRETLGLTGSKKGCDHGQCGACTVLSNGRRINSCLSLALSHEGDEITTIEGLANADQLHRLQAAFIEHDGLQCGYCTPGQICSGVAMLAEASRGDASFVTADLRRPGNVELTEIEIRERMSGNICRCGAYPGIVGAVQAVLASHEARRG